MGRMGSITLHGQFSLSGSCLLPPPGTNRICLTIGVQLNGDSMHSGILWCMFQVIVTQNWASKSQEGGLYIHKCDWTTKRSNYGRRGRYSIMHLGVKCKSAKATVTRVLPREPTIQPPPGEKVPLSRVKRRLAPSQRLWAIIVWKLSWTATSGILQICCICHL